VHLTTLSPITMSAKELAKEEKSWNCSQATHTVYCSSTQEKRRVGFDCLCYSILIIAGETEVCSYFHMLSHLTSHFMSCTVWHLAYTESGSIKQHVDKSGRFCILTQGILCNSVHLGRISHLLTQKLWNHTVVEISQLHLFWIKESSVLSIVDNPGAVWPPLPPSSGTDLAASGHMGFPLLGQGTGVCPSHPLK
jgi:hypothetical protein